jgi:hypothetical protein
VTSPLFWGFRLGHKDKEGSIEMPLTWKQIEKMEELRCFYMDYMKALSIVVDAGTLRESLPTDGTQHGDPSRDQTS